MDFCLRVALDTRLKHAGMTIEKLRHSREFLAGISIMGLSSNAEHITARYFAAREYLFMVSADGEVR